MIELNQAEDMAYLRADLCLYSPGIYMLDAMREGFESMPPELRSKLLDMLCAPSAESLQWWWDVLVADGDPLYRELEPLGFLMLSETARPMRGFRTMEASESLALEGGRGT